jgi:ATPase subunit of ABC transporter with duplicated ATPase domains
MGHREMWNVRRDKDAIYADPDATEEDYVRAAELESTFAEQDGYTAETRAGELAGIGIAQSLHDGPMSAVAPGWKLRVLLAQVCGQRTSCPSTSRPTISTSTPSAGSRMC